MHSHSGVYRAQLVMQKKMMASESPARTQFAMPRWRKTPRMSAPDAIKITARRHKLVAVL